MTISKKLQKLLAVTLMTSFLSTSFVMGVSEAAAARPNGGGRPPAQSQQIRRETQKGPSGHQMKAPMQRQRSDHQARPAVHKSAPTQRMQSMHKSGPNHKAQPMAHKNGSIRQGSSIHHGGPAMHKGGPGHKAQPMMHKGGSIHRSGPVMHRNGPNHKAQPMAHKGGSIRHGGPVIQQHHPAPPPRHHHHDDYRSMHSGDWIGALVIGGIIGAIIANNSHRASHPNYVEYAD